LSGQIADKQSAKHPMDRDEWGEPTSRHEVIARAIGRARYNGRRKLMRAWRRKQAIDALLATAATFDLLLERKLSAWIAERYAVSRTTAWRDASAIRCRVLHPREPVTRVRCRCVEAREQAEREARRVGSDWWEEPEPPPRRSRRVRHRPGRLLTF
jgi:hypothetical protein